jgi:hypothetical protein
VSKYNFWHSILYVYVALFDVNFFYNCINVMKSVYL